MGTAHLQKSGLDAAMCLLTDSAGMQSTSSFSALVMMSVRVFVGLLQQSYKLKI